MNRLDITYLNPGYELLEPYFTEARYHQLNSAFRLYNRWTGPVTSIHLLRPELLDLPIYSTFAQHVPVGKLLRDVRIKFGPDSNPLPGGGKGVRPGDALLGGLAEMTERLLSSLHWKALAGGRIVHSTYESLAKRGRRALSPEEMPIFSAEQYATPGFPYTPFSSGTPLGWIEGVDLLTGDNILVPAQLVLMYYKRRSGEPMVGYATSAGLAFHTSRLQALLHGLYEVIERDCLNICWYARLAPPRVLIDLAEFLADYTGVRPSRISTPYLHDLGVYLLTLDLPVPAFAVIARDSSRIEKAFQGGTGAAAQRDQGLAQALFEVGQSQTGFKLINPFGRRYIQPDSDLSTLVDFHDAPLFYGHRQNLDRTLWFTDSGQTIPWSHIATTQFRDAAEEYEASREWLQVHSIQPIAFDLGSAGWQGISITKIFVPQLTQACPPLDPTLGHPRFYRLAEKLGRMDRTLNFDDLTIDPIPFA
jgi:ribosomal protein S12 methylthiotransferase accessory factor